MTSKVTALARATGIEDPAPVSGAGTGRPDPEVPARASRRTFTATYKEEILAAYDAAPDGEKGALLRREGLYSSHIVAGGGPAMPPDWPLSPSPAAGSRATAAGADRPAGGRETWLEQELAKARFVVDLQAKLYGLLETLSESTDTEPRSTPMTDTRSPTRPADWVRAACEAVGAAQAGYYRRHRQSRHRTAGPVPHRERRQPRALTGRTAGDPRGAAQRPVRRPRARARCGPPARRRRLPRLVSTFYRLLREAGEVRERRRQATHPAKAKPELIAPAPNQIWSWDITKLRGPAKARCTTCT